MEISKDLKNPSHETVALLCSLSLSDTTRLLVSDFIALRIDGISALPPRLFLLAPQSGIRHLEADKHLLLAEFDHVKWESGGAALALIAEDRPELVAPAVKPFVDAIASGIAGYHRNYTGEEAALLIRVLIESAPDVWESVLMTLDVRVAEESLATCLSQGREHRRAAALVVDTARRMHGEIGEMARRLRRRFPKASVP